MTYEDRVGFTIIGLVLFFVIAGAYHLIEDDERGKKECADAIGIEYSAWNGYENGVIVYRTHLSNGNTACCIENRHITNNGLIEKYDKCVEVIK